MLEYILLQFMQFLIKCKTLNSIKKVTWIVLRHIILSKSLLSQKLHRPEVSHDNQIRDRGYKNFEIKSGASELEFFSQGMTVGKAHTCLTNVAPVFPQPTDSSSAFNLVLKIASMPCYHLETSRIRGQESRPPPQ